MHPALPALGLAAFQAGFHGSLPPPSPPGAGYVDAMATASLQPASPTSGLLPFRSGSIIHVSNEEFLPSAPPSAKVKQQVGCTQIISLSFMERARFESFSAVCHQARSGWRELGLRDCEVVSVPCMYHRDFHCPLLSQHLSLWPFLILRILMVVSLM